MFRIIILFEIIQALNVFHDCQPQNRESKLIHDDSIDQENHSYEPIVSLKKGELNEETPTMSTIPMKKTEFEV